MGSDANKPDFSDVQGSVTSGTSAAPFSADFRDVQSQVGSTVDEAVNYTVAAGDNLSKIAEHFRSHANAWKSTFDANRDQPPDPDRIKRGQVLKIPSKF